MRTLRSVAVCALLTSACGRCNYVETLVDGGGLADRRVDAPFRVDGGRDGSIVATDAGRDGGIVATDANPDAAPMCPPSPGTCDYQCAFDVIAGTTSCNGVVTVETMAPGVVTAQISMTDVRRLEMYVRVCNPTGFWIHLGDSPTNSGFGGDSGTATHDAELHPVDTTFFVFEGDLNPTIMHAFPMWVPAAGCSDRMLAIEDSAVTSCSGPIMLSGPGFFRINPPPGTEGTPDAIWYLGIGRTYGSSARSGTGVERVLLCFTT